LPGEKLETYSLNHCTSSRVLKVKKALRLLKSNTAAQNDYTLYRTKKILNIHKILNSGEMPDENQKKLLNRRKTGSILQTTAPHLNLGSLKVRKILASTCTCLITVKNM